MFNTLREDRHWVVLWGALALTLMLSSAFIGCAPPAAAPRGPEAPAGGEEAPAEAATVRTLVPVDWRPILDEIAPEFEAETGAKLEVISTAYDEIHDKIVSSARGGADIDLVYVDTIWPGEFAQAGFLQPVDDLVTEEMREGIYKPLLDQLVWQDQLWAVPFNNQAKWLLYNKEMLEAAGFDSPPTSWSEMREMSRVMVEQGIAKYGTAWGWTQAEGIVCDWTLLLHDFGGRWRDEDGAWVFNSPEGVAALTFMVESIQEGGWADPASVSLNDRTDLNPFMAGDIPFVINWAFAWGLVNDPNESDVAGKVGITLIPGVEEAGTRSATSTGGGGFGLLKEAPNPELAKTLMGKLVSREIQAQALKLQGNMPIWRELYSDPQILTENPQMEDMGPQYEYGYWRPVLPWYTEWSQHMQLELQNALTGVKSPQKALDDAVEFSNQKSAEYGY